MGGTYRAPTFLAGFDAATSSRTASQSHRSLARSAWPGATLVLSDAGVTFSTARRRWPARFRYRLRRCDRPRPISPSASTSMWSGLDPRFLTRRSGTTRNSRAPRRSHRAFGHVARPRSSGTRLTDHGSYVSDLERAPDLADRGGPSSFNRSSAAESSGRRRRPETAPSRPPATSVSQRAFRGRPLVLAFTGRLAGAQLDLPAYGNGTVDGQLTTDSRQPSSDALLSGMRR